MVFFPVLLGKQFEPNLIVPGYFDALSDEHFSKAYWGFTADSASPRYSGACALSLASALTGGGGTVDGGSLVLGVLSALSGAFVGVVGMCCEFVECCDVKVKKQK